MSQWNSLFCIPYTKYVKRVSTKSQSLQWSFFVLGHRPMPGPPLFSRRRVLFRPPAPTARPSHFWQPRGLSELRHPPWPPLRLRGASLNCFWEHGTPDPSSQLTSLWSLWDEQWLIWWIPSAGRGPPGLLHLATSPTGSSAVFSKYTRGALLL